MPTVAITGGTGFVGRALIAELLGRGFEVVSLVRSASASGAAEGRQGTFREIVSGDLTDADYGSAIPAGIDAVIHCAARVHVMRDRAADPLAAFRKANVDATISLARHAAHREAGRFVYLSSIKVNGERTRLGCPFKASDPARPLDPYGTSKLEAETALRAFGAKTGLGVSIIRPPLVYGPGVKGNLALLARLLRSGFPVPLGGVTGNRRSLIAVGNLADLAVRCVTHPEAVGRTFLASDDDDLSTAELMRAMAEAMGRPARLLPVPPALITLLARAIKRPELAERLCGSLQVDVAATRQRLNWTPPVSIKVGLAAAFSSERFQ